MTKNKALFALSIFLILLPYIGFQKSSEDSLVIISGIILFVLTYLYIKEGRMKDPKHTVVTENKRYFDNEGDFVGGEIDVTEEIVLDSDNEEN
jgi:hypothetical protein